VRRHETFAGENQFLPILVELVGGTLRMVLDDFLMHGAGREHGEFDQTVGLALGFVAKQDRIEEVRRNGRVGARGVDDETAPAARAAAARPVPLSILGALNKE
jgi:hypothetical protein